MAAPRPHPASPPSRGVVSLEHSASRDPDAAQYTATAEKRDKLFAARVAHLAAARTRLQLDLLRQKLRRLKEHATANNNTPHPSLNANHAALQLARFVHATADSLSVSTPTATTKPPGPVPKNGLTPPRASHHAAGPPRDPLPSPPPPAHPIAASPASSSATPAAGPSAAAPAPFAPPQPHSLLLTLHHATGPPRDALPPSPPPAHSIADSPASFSATPAAGPPAAVPARVAYPHPRSLPLTLHTPLPSPARPPPLLAKLYFAEELAAHFVSPALVRACSPPPPAASLHAAVQTYRAHLFPPPPPNRGEQSVHPTPQQPHAAQVQTPQSRVLACAAARRQRCDHQPFQTRTYVADMTRADERRAPTAPWPTRPHQPPASSEDTPVMPASGYGYASYRVDAHPAVSGSGRRVLIHHHTTPAGCASNFGFQKQTNYPFRLTYSTSTSQASDSPRQSTMRHDPRLELQVARRVPLQALPPPLRQLLSAAVMKPRGAFFRPDQSATTTTFGCVRGDQDATDDVYTIGEDGRLERRGAGV